jgi:glutamate synthase domain-containing protein 3
VTKFLKVMPTDYRRVLQEQKKAAEAETGVTAIFHG